MVFLFDSQGQHIATWVQGHLHTPSGHNIGQYLAHEQIFIDRRGHYLGEIRFGNRLVRQRHSRYKAVNFGVQGSVGTVGNFGSPGSIGRVTLSRGYEDIPADLLK